VSKARNQVQTLVNGREVGWRPRLKTLLLPPIDVAEEFRSGEEVRQASGKWCSEVALWYRNNLAGKYPFVREAREDAAVGDVAAFFRPGTGLVWKFYNESLARNVQRAGRGFQFVRAGERTPPYRAELLTFLKRAQDLTAALFPPGSTEPNVAMTVRVRPTPRIAAVFLDLDGQRIEYRNGPEEWNKVVWPGGGKTNSASLRVRAAGGADETLMRDGDWAVFRLLESGNVRVGAGSQTFTIGFPMRTLGAEITMDFRPARSETPFFATAHGAGARFLEPFRNLVLPLSIGGPPCTEGASAGR
jgi:type VI secretion system protein ImpL